MSILDKIESLQKKPIETRRRFALFLTILFSGIIMASWFSWLFVFKEGEKELANRDEYSPLSFFQSEDFKKMSDSFNNLKKSKDQAVAQIKESFNIFKNEEGR